MLLPATGAPFAGDSYGWTLALEGKKAYLQPSSGDTMARRPDERLTPESDTEPELPTGRAKTSAAAVLALVFGLLALVTWLLPPLAILFGIIAFILGIVGISKADGHRVTGKGIATTGLVLGLIGLLLGVAIIVGIATFLTNEQNLEWIENRIQDLRDQLPSELPPP